MLLPRSQITRHKLCFYYTCKFGVISIKYMIKNNTEPIEFNKINNYTYLKTISINMPFINKKTETSYVAFGTYLLLRALI